MSNLSPEWLRLLAAMGKADNLAKAGEILGLTQGAVSLKLKALESQFQSPLFTTIGRRKVLTPFGQALQKLAEEQLTQLDDRVHALMAEYEDPRRLNLRIACRRELFALVMKNVRFPGRLDFQFHKTDHGVELLLAGKVDMAVAYRVPDSTEVISRKIFLSGAVVICPKSMLGGKKLTMEKATMKQMFTRLPAIVYDTNLSLVRDCLHRFDVKPEEIPVRMIVEDWLSIADAVEMGLGWAVVPKTVSLLARKIESIEMPQNLVPGFTYYALYNRALTKTPAYRKLF
ncbi:MAG: LysR family transcriptional regulator [Bdellovibrionales bacterium]